MTFDALILNKPSTNVRTIMFWKSISNQNQGAQDGEPIKELAQSIGDFENFRFQWKRHDHDGGMINW